MIYISNMLLRLQTTVRRRQLGVENQGQILQFLTRPLSNLGKMLAKGRSQL